MTSLIPGSFDDFLRQFWADVNRGDVHPVSAYVERFPDHRTAIEAEYAEALRQSLSAQGSVTPATSSGNTLGPYRLETEIGRGGQGVVYRATHIRTGGRVAVKVLPNLGPGTERLLGYFRREAEIAARLDHPGLCPVFDAQVAGGSAWIAMRYVEGCTLAQLLEGANPSPETHLESRVSAVDLPTEVLGPADPGTAPRRGTQRTGPISRTTIDDRILLIEKAARALHAAHEAGVIHRDIKPGNIMVTPTGEPVIMDFGLARGDDPDLESLTQTGDLFGTPPYMSPEQLTRSTVTLDRRTDVWSLGVTLYEAVTGQRPFEAPTREALYQHILARNPADPRSVNPSVGRDLSVVLATALEKDRERRYQSAQHLADELERIRLHRPIVARPIGPLTRFQRWCQRNPGVAAAVGGAFLVLVAGLIVTAILLQNTQTALSEAESERRRADSNADAAARNLQEYERLSDAFRLDGLEAEAETLWPPGPQLLPSLRAWLVRVDDVTSTLPELEGDLDALERIGRALSEPVEPDPDARSLAESELRFCNREIGALEEDPELHRPAHPDDSEQTRELRRRRDALLTVRKDLEARLSSRTRWEFDSSRQSWRHLRLAEFVQRLRTFLNPDPMIGTLASVQKRVQDSESIQERFEQDKALWTAVVGDIAVDPRYGFDLIPEAGLVPLGRDPESKLHEFAVLLSGRVPERTKDGSGPLVETEDMAIVLVLIPGGEIFVGAQSEDPIGPNYDPKADGDERVGLPVRLDAYFISKYEMTQYQWQHLTGDNPSLHPPGAFGISLRNPVERVSHEDAVDVLRRVGLILPTEAQWEHACRAGEAARWFTGPERDSLIGHANIADSAARRMGLAWADIPDWPEFDDGFGLHAPVGKMRPNAFGLYDTLGNVWEWCLDCYAPYNRPTRPGDGYRLAIFRTHRVVRGGGFTMGADVCRSACRRPDPPTLRDADLGFRPARVARY